VRILVVDTWYERVLERVYAQQPDLAGSSYEQQWQALMATAFGTGDAYSHYLAELGHEAHELIVNCVSLQRAWAREHGVEPRVGVRERLRGEDLRAALVVKQAVVFRPDVVYVQNLNVLPAATLRRLRNSARLLVGQLGIEPPSRAQLRAFDLIVTSLPHFVPRLQVRGLRAEYLPLAFDPRVLDRLGPRPAKREQAVFVGSVSRFQHGRGSAVLEQAAERAPLSVWGIGIDEWPDESALRRAYRGEAWGLEMYARLAEARIAVNRHSDFAEDYANNMRLYEATGVGTFLLTDAKRNLPELFEPGREVVTYASADELVEKIGHYLERDSEREAIAAAGQQRTLSDHTYGTRMRELAELLERALARRRSAA
jgi:spore maturation protein CgeB